MIFGRKSSNSGVMYPEGRRVVRWGVGRWR
jgi:hypothetical protein